MFKFLAPTIFIGISVAGFILFTNPLYQDVLSEKEQIKSYDEALGNSKALEAERDKLTQKYNSFSPESLSRLEKLLPDNVDNIRLILEIENIAKPYGMVLKDVKYDTKSENPENTSGVVQANKNLSGNRDYGTWDLEFSTQGTYNSFTKFVKDLESNLRIVDISSVQFISNAGSNIGGINPSLPEAYKYDFKIKTYWLKN